MDHIKEAHSIIYDLLKAFQDAAAKDDACVGYKSRQAIFDRANKFIGTDERITPEHTKDWMD